jgi:hypothetical protein
MRFSPLVHVGLLASVVAACGDVADPTLTPPSEFTEAPGLLIDGPPPFESLIVPPIVTQGVPFLVTASSFGSSNCTEVAGHESVIFATRAEIRLFDRIALDESGCTQDLRAFTRTLIVEFTEAGAAEVVVIGRDGDGKPLEIRRSVSVHANP